VLRYPLSFILTGGGSQSFDLFASEESESVEEIYYFLNEASLLHLCTNDVRAAMHATQAILELVAAPRTDVLLISVANMTHCFKCCKYFDLQWKQQTTGCVATESTLKQLFKEVIEKKWPKFDSSTFKKPQSFPVSAHMYSSRRE
jgi:hypothetical protein